MANVLSADKQATIIGALAEGSGIRQIERMTGVHRDTPHRAIEWDHAASMRRLTRLTYAFSKNAKTLKRLLRSTSPITIS